MKEIATFALNATLAAAAFFGVWVVGRFLLIPDDVQVRQGLKIALILGPTLALWTTWAERRTRAGKAPAPASFLIALGVVCLCFWGWVGFIADRHFVGSERYWLLAFSGPPIYLIVVGIRSIRSSKRARNETAT